ncbi:MAG TPA: hypothetical protein PKE69_02720 [Pyrinomonadaceae bacterium]|nr:hypothetical protein [Pyrinomonadaceae bacterium]
MNILEEIQIWRISENRTIKAKIVELTRDIAQTKIDGRWWDLTDVPRSKRKKENDNHWNWTRNVGLHRNQILWECVAVLSAENEIEGAMIVRFDVKSRIESDEGCVYVDLLSTAPRNRDWLVDKPIYKGIGTELLYWAVRKSFELGFNGRVALDADPKPKTLEFYQNRRFQKVVPIYEELIGYELSAENAEIWVSERR